MAGIFGSGEDAAEHRRSEARMDRLSAGRACSSAGEDRTDLAFICSSPRFLCLRAATEGESESKINFAMHRFFS